MSNHAQWSAQVAVKESLEDIAYLQQRVRAIIAERGRLYARLRQQGLLQPLPSEANFILSSAPDGRARQIKQGLEREGIFIRYFDTPLLKDMVRISVGKPEHTDALIKALDRMG